MAPFGAPAPSGAAEGAGRGAGHRGTARQRSRASLRPLWWSMPIVVLATAASILLLGLHFWALAANHAWAQGNLDAAQSDYDAQVSVTAHGPERWVARYNSGTTMLARGDIDAGVSQLRRALETVPNATEVSEGHVEAYSYECRVRMNLAFGIEAQGDQSVTDDQWSEAADHYDESASVLEPCDTSSDGQSQSGQSGDQQSGSGSSSGGDGSDPGQQAGSARDRVEQKSQDARDRAQGGDSSAEESEQGSGGSSGSDASPSPSPTPSESEAGQASPSPSATSDPFSGETDQERQRREELEKKLERWQNDQDGGSDQNRSGLPDGGW